MVASFPNQDNYPFNTVVYISVGWNDGTFSRGSGALVGRNDILTAAHVVYNPSKTATDIDIYPAYDGAAGPWGAFTSGRWTTNYYQIAFTSDGRLITDAAAYDIAVIGISEAIGDRTGYLGMASYAGSGTYDVLGYPAAQGTRLTLDSGYTSVSNGVFNIGNTYHAPGSSGGPLVNASRQVVGVVSTDSWAARIDLEWDQIRSWISGNDNLLGVAPSEFFIVTNNSTGTTTQVAGSKYSGPVEYLQLQFIGSDASEVVVGTQRNDFIDTKGGTDTVVFSSSRENYRIGMADGWMRVSGPDGNDVLKDVESVKFGASTAITAQSLRNAPGTEELMSFLTGGRLSFELPIEYTGPNNLRYVYPGTDADDIVAGTSSNDFINLAGGNDAVHMGRGDDVVDGGGGSNFLSGDAGSDTFFLDGRFLVPVWSCITDWEIGEGLTLWGWRSGISNASWKENDGLPGYTGATMTADIDGNGSVETAITWTGKTISELPNFEEMEVSGIGVLYFK